MERLCAAADCEDGRPLCPLHLPHHVSAEPEPDLIRAGDAAICGGGQLRSERGDVCFAELNQFAKSGSNNSKTQR